MSNLTPTTAKKQSNDLRHVINTWDTEGNPLKIEISVNDKCKNGHQDIHITGDIYIKGKPRTDNNIQMCGCLHEIILAAKPELKLFVDLHGCDYTGCYYIPNMLYNLTNGFNNIKPDNKEFKQYFCDSYRLSEGEFNKIKDSENETILYVNLLKLGVIEAWQKDANEAINLLEQWTDTEFINDSKRTYYTPPTAEKIKEEAKRLKIGYYTAEAIKARKIAKIEANKEKALKEIETEYKKEVKKHKLERDIKTAIILAGLTLDNFIFYNHTKEGVFNWKSYDTLTTQEEFNKFVQSVNFKGVTFKLGK